MSHALNVPDELYSKFAEYAAERGQTADELLLAYMRGLVEISQSGRASEAIVITEDPLAPFIGAFTFGVGDLAENHDQYLAQSPADSRDANQ